MGTSANPDRIDPRPTLERRLGVFDGTLLTIGSVVGTGIFLTSDDVARALPDTALFLLVWLVGGALTLAGALTYAELGAMYPRAGGIYHFLKEAYGPLWGFLYGWTSFLVIMSGGIAALAVGFGDSLGGLVPFFASHRIVWNVRVAEISWSVSSSQLAAVVAIVLLTAVNHFGLRSGAWTQNVLTMLKAAALGALIGCGLYVAAPELTAATATSPSASTTPTGLGILAPFGVAMVAVLWTFDGWYGLTFSAGEMRKPERDLPRALCFGTIAIIVLYVLTNIVYLRALPLETMATTERVGEAAAIVLFGAIGGNVVAVIILLSILGCLASTILYSSRIYMPMAVDGVFFRSAATIHPKFRVPVGSLWCQSLWAIVLTLSGRYEQLFTFAVFASLIFHAATACSLFVLRRRRPDVPRPYRVWGYPVLPFLFIAGCLLIVATALVETPRESFAGLGLVALGVPAYAFWRRQARAGRRSFG
ncbi:MAG: APC family permease [Planctomycetota bacterium]